MELETLTTTSVFVDIFRLASIEAERAEMFGPLRACLTSAFLHAEDRHNLFVELAADVPDGAVDILKMVLFDLKDVERVIPIGESDLAGAKRVFGSYHGLVSISDALCGALNEPLRELFLKGDPTEIFECVQNRLSPIPVPTAIKVEYAFAADRHRATTS